MNFCSLFGISHVLTVKVGAFIELVVHPYAVQSLFTVALAEPGMAIHALTLDELQLGTHFEDFLLS